MYCPYDKFYLQSCLARHVRLHNIRSRYVKYQMFKKEGRELSGTKQLSFSCDIVNMLRK